MGASGGVTQAEAVLVLDVCYCTLPPRSTWAAECEHTGLVMWLQGDGYLVGQGLGMLLLSHLE